MGFRGRIFKFWDPYRKFGTGVARIFKFCTLIHLGTFHLMGDKIPIKWAWYGPGTNFKILGPSINFEMVN